MSQLIQVPLTETSYKTNIITTLDDNTFGHWIIGGSAKLLKNTKRNLKQSQMCGAFPHKKERISSAGSQIPCIAASAENIKELEGTLQNLAIIPRLCATCSCVLCYEEYAAAELQRSVTVQCIIWIKMEEKEKLHVILVFFLRPSLCVKLNVSRVFIGGLWCCVQGRFGLWRGIFGGDPLSVMGQGHTMGALCKLCWGCAVVGKGPALISVRMFSGVCHVWKVIPSLTFPSHNCLRICVNRQKVKKVYQWIILEAIHI